MFCKWLLLDFCHVGLWGWVLVLDERASIREIPPVLFQLVF
jgi:hypothetical protein